MRHSLTLVILTLTSISFTFGQNDWIFRDIAEGTKPTAISDINNGIHIGALAEDTGSGWLGYTKIDGNSVKSEIVEEGYFYGPIDIIVDDNANPIIAFHHHNVGESDFRGELAFAKYLSAGNWTIDVVSNQGHDGWDGTFEMDASETIHAISTDPSNGVEYSFGSGSNHTIEHVDATNAMYQYGTDIHLDPVGNVHATFFIDGESTLKYATRNNGMWTVDSVDANAVFPSMILTGLGPVIAYYKTSRNDGSWGTDGQIMVARKIGNNWQYQQVETLQNVQTGVFSGARAIVDIQLDGNGVEHLAFGNNKIVKYGTYNGADWAMETVLDANGKNYDLGQQVSMALSPNGEAHIVTYRRTTGANGIVMYGTNGSFQLESTLNCPPDTTIHCDVLITPDVTGFPDTTGGFTNFIFVDSVIQECPGDLILERSWIGLIGTIPTDTCTQLITVLVDSIDAFQFEDTLRIDEVCLNDLDEAVQIGLDLPCNVGIDSIDITIVEQSCERIVYDATWDFGDQCRDTAFTLNQTIIIENRQVAKLDQTQIQNDSGDASGSITLFPNCIFDTLIYQWSTGSTDSLITSLMADTYSVTITDEEGCTDTLIFDIAETIIDTMMMDTMMMDTMMMDTMMMDTMMMDTMMMDTMMMDTMMMDTMMIDTMMMDTMMMDTMMMDTMMMDTMMMDTMMMDTMMMDTMMMDTMMMDTMMMDTMMMDTMMMDTMMMDTMMMDTMMMDTMMMDTMMMDTMMMDTMMMDTMMMDTMMMDTMMMDTMMMDTMMMDTMMMDTMMMDTMMMDTMMMDTMMMDTMMMDTMMMDTMMMDTMMIDTMMMDTMMMDTMMMDTMMMDTMMMDTMMMDTMMMDTMMMDTMMMDTMMMDTMMMDTMMMDTMMMDTMMMDTMMMDSMMMDTMMMDTMMMDTMMMDTMGVGDSIGMSMVLSISGRDSVVMAIDSIYFMTTDSTFIGARLDSIGGYTANISLKEVAAVCLAKDGDVGEDLSVTDLTKGVRIILQFTPGCDEDRVALDVTDDGVVSALDLAFMRSILLNRIDDYPSNLVYKFVKTDWGFSPDASNGSCISLSDADRARGSLNILAIKLGDIQCDE